MAETFENQIEGVIKSALENLKSIVDVNTVVGKPIKTEDGNVIIPLSKVTLGFFAGGGEYGLKEGMAETRKRLSYPIAAGTGGYVQLTPIGFLSSRGDVIKTIEFNSSVSPYDRLAEFASEFVGNLAKKDDKK